MFVSDLAKILAWQYDHRVDRPDLRQLRASPALGDSIQQLIDSRNALQIRVKAIHEQRVQHVTGYMGKTWEYRWLRRIGIRVHHLVADANDENAIGTEMDGRTQRRRLAHCTVTEVLTAKLHRWEYHRYSDARHQVVEVNIAANSIAALAAPFMSTACRLKKRSRSSRPITRCSHGKCMQITIIDGLLNERESNIGCKQRPQWRIIQQ